MNRRIEQKSRDKNKKGNLIMRSIPRPMITATTALIACISISTDGAARSEINIGSISSEVERKTAMSVPAVIILPE